MASTREQVIQAVVDLVKAALPQAAHYRNGAKPKTLPVGGYANVDDGDPGDPEVTLNPTTWIYEHEIPVELAIGGKGAETAEIRLDTMMRAIGAAVESNRTLGGLCDYLQVSAALTEPLTAEGANVYRFGIVGITAVYGTTDPLN